MFRLGYNTNGLAHHRPADALRLVSELGYEALALTPDPGCLDPWNLNARELSDLGSWSEELGMALVIETGSRYLLDAKRKHFPTLLEASSIDRGRRLDFLKRCVDMAAALGAGVVSIWSGAAPTGLAGDWPAPEATAENAAAVEVTWSRLVAGTAELLQFADGSGVQLAFEPEPGMFVAQPAGYGELLERLGKLGDGLGLTLDVGHCLVTGDDVTETICRWAPWLVNVHLDDIAGGQHEHRMFGEGDLDLGAALRALVEVGFADVAAVELSRDSHRGPVAAREAMEHIRCALGRAH